MRRWAFLRFRNQEIEETKSEKRSWVVPLAAVGLFIIVAGIVVETFAEGRVSDVETRLRAHESDLLTSAEGAAASAIAQAGDAKGSAKSAAEASAIAKGASGEAVRSASSALNDASLARGEADSFEKDIVSAKTQAANAESHLADALQRTAHAEEELERERSPRTLIRATELKTSLDNWRGTTYTLQVAADTEPITFAQALAAVLKDSGWIRRQPTGSELGVPTLSVVFDKDAGAEVVPACIDAGVSIHARIAEKAEDFANKPFPTWPKSLQAAYALKVGLRLSVLPATDRNTSEYIADPPIIGEGLPMLTCVGRKP